MRYLVLILLNVPVILFALLNIVTQYKMRRASSRRFRQQFLLWLIILLIIVSSFPAYNFLIGRPILDSTDLSAFDIVEVTAIIFLFYIANDQRHKIDLAERRLRDLHQELSIKLSERK